MHYKVNLFSHKRATQPSIYKSKWSSLPRLAVITSATNSPALSTAAGREAPHISSEISTALNTSQVPMKLSSISS